MISPILTRSLYRKVIRKVHKLSTTSSSSTTSTSTSSTPLISAVFLNLLPPDAVLEYCYLLKKQQLEQIEQENNKNKNTATTKRSSSLDDELDLEHQPTSVAKILFRDCLKQLEQKLSKVGDEEHKSKLSKEHLLYGFEAVRRLSLMHEAEARTKLTPASERKKLAAASSSSSSSENNNNIIITPETQLKYPQILSLSNTKVARVFELPIRFRSSRAAVALSDHTTASYLMQDLPEDNDDLEGLPAELKKELSEVVAADEKEKLSPKVMTLYQQILENRVEPLWTRTHIQDKEHLPLSPAVLLSIMKLSSSQRNAVARSTSVSKTNNNAQKQNETVVDDFVVENDVTSSRSQLLKTMLVVDTPIQIPEALLERKRKQQENNKENEVDEDNDLERDGEFRNLFGHVRVCCSARCLDNEVFQNPTGSNDDEDDEDDDEDHEAEDEIIARLSGGGEGGRTTSVRRRISDNKSESHFSYKIRIENNSKEFSVICLTRHWHFADLNRQSGGTVTDVGGPGLVGFMPFLPPTAVTSYESGTSLVRNVIEQQEKKNSSSSSSHQNKKKKTYGSAEGIMLGKFQCIAIPKTDYAKTFCPSSGFQFDIDVGPIALNSTIYSYEMFPPTMKELQ